MEPVPTRNIGSGQFVIGDTKVRPRVTATFHNDEKLGMYIQLYHLDPNSVIEYQITRNGTDAVVLHETEEARGSSSQLTVKKWILLADLAAGFYTLRFNVTNGDRTQTVAPSAEFTVTAR
jgi:hypothetical protein